MHQPEWNCDVAARCRSIFVFGLQTDQAVHREYWMRSPAPGVDINVQTVQLSIYNQVRSALCCMVVRFYDNLILKKNSRP